MHSLLVLRADALMGCSEEPEGATELALITDTSSGTRPRGEQTARCLMARARSGRSKEEPREAAPLLSWK